MMAEHGQGSDGGVGCGQLASAWDGDFWVDTEAQKRVELILTVLDDLLHDDAPSSEVLAPPLPPSSPSR